MALQRNNRPPDAYKRFPFGKGETLLARARTIIRLPNGDVVCFHLYDWYI